jgi:hypothetical protein
LPDETACRDEVRGALAFGRQRGTVGIGMQHFGQGHLRALR